ncbi:unnamed protein product [Gongylonema pulchrum]|uniref:BHLH domain-containing protein n=1 Tax=Gongylonema pulchrum TaxID=637853 RepID=A0A183E7H5_9BILA|nr:unnamed protein product [Gongylonema pulchrum]
MSARNRRDQENRELESLAQCLPLASAITSQLDKSMSARNQRDQENRELESLAQCLPLASAITSQLDKASIIRLATAYLALRNVLQPPMSYVQDGKFEMGSFLLQTLDGFVVILDATGKMIYISETASVHLGLSQASIIRLASAYLALRNVLQQPMSYVQDGKFEIGSFLLQTLEGFIVILDATGKMIYISETASIHLGLSQVNTFFDVLQQL